MSSLPTTPPPTAVCRCSSVTSPPFPSSSSNRTTDLPKATTVPSPNFPTTNTTSSSTPMSRYARRIGMHPCSTIWMNTPTALPANQNSWHFDPQKLSTLNCQLSTITSMPVLQEASSTSTAIPSVVDVSSTPSSPMKGSTTTWFPCCGAQVPPFWCVPPTGEPVEDSTAVSSPTWKR